MKKIVVGTAGHIDHGKTELIKAITGIDCDRLKEEKERGITTELGFAHYRLGNDVLMGIVDVPGHERFVRHMVAGAWGIDMVLLVVAADEGVMPQTREHVDICELLGLKQGIVVITKKDLVDEEMLALVTDDIKAFLSGRFLDGAPIIPVSSTTGENIDTLKDAIAASAYALPERSTLGIFRLPVDRVFTIKGLGTIITGTCISGSIRIGEEIEIYPLLRRARIRNIQAYHEDVEEAFAGQRVALNLQGVEKHEIDRGVIIGRPDTLMLTHRVDATFSYLSLPYKPMKNDMVLRFHIGTSQREARMVLLTHDSIAPGEEQFVQWVFSHPVVALPHDRYIIRGSYAIQTIGGGEILDIMPPKHKRKGEHLNRLYPLLSHGTLVDQAEYHIKKSLFQGITHNQLTILMGKDKETVTRTIQSLLEDKRINIMGKTILHAEILAEYKKMLSQTVSDFHTKNPLKIGISKEELRTRLPSVDNAVYQKALEECAHEGLLEVDKDKVRLSHKNKGTETDALERSVTTVILNYGLTPPALKDVALELNIKETHLKDILERLVHHGTVIKIKSDMYVHRDVLETFEKKVVSYLTENKEMTPSDFKTKLPLSRKYMIPLLEYLDEIKLTIRIGDKRILRTSHISSKNK